MPPGIGYGRNTFVPSSTPQYSPEAQAFGQQIGQMYPTIDPDLLGKLGSAALNYHGTLSPTEVVPLHYMRFTGESLPAFGSPAYNSYMGAPNPAPAPPPAPMPNPLEILLALPNVNQLLLDLGLGNLLPAPPQPVQQSFSLGDLIGGTQNPTNLLSMLTGGRR